MAWSKRRAGGIDERWTADPGRFRDPPRYAAFTPSPSFWHSSLGVASRRARRFLDDMALLKRDNAAEFRRLADQVRRLEAEDGPGLPEATAAPSGGKERTT